MSIGALSGEIRQLPCPVTGRTFGIDSGRGPACNHSRQRVCMYLTQLSTAEQEIVLRCLRALYEGPFLDDLDFRTRTGVERERLPALLERWPALDDRDDEGDDAVLISNAMNEIANGVRLSTGEWRRWFGDLPREAVGATLVRWRDLREDRG